MPQIFKTQRLVEFSDTDMAGIMHFAAFFRYMESIEHEFLRSLGLSVFGKFDGETLSFHRVAAACDFKSPAKCEDRLDATLAITRLGASSITYQIDFFRNQRPVATGTVTCVCCLIEPHRPPASRPLPKDVRAVLQPFVDSPS